MYPQISTYIFRNFVKLLLFFLLVAAFFIVGAMIGFGVLGEGEATRVFHHELWEKVFSYFR